MFPQRQFALTVFILLASLTASTSTAQTPPNNSQEAITIKVTEGTNLAFDISSDGQSIVFDLLGQLWLVPARGGKARPITDSICDIAEDSDPSFAPDGHRVVFSGERNGRTGLWLLNLDSGGPRQLTQLPDPDGFDRNAAWSPDGRMIAFEHAVPPNSPKNTWRTGIMLLDVESGTTRELSISGVESPFLGAPV